MNASTSSTLPLPATHGHIPNTNPPVRKPAADRQLRQPRHASRGRPHVIAIEPDQADHGADRPRRISHHLRRDVERSLRISAPISSTNGSITNGVGSRFVTTAGESTVANERSSCLVRFDRFLRCHRFPSPLSLTTVARCASLFSSASSGVPLDRDGRQSRRGPR